MPKDLSPRYYQKREASKKAFWLAAILKLFFRINYYKTIFRSLFFQYIKKDFGNFCFR